MTIRHSRLAQRVSSALQDDPRTRDATIDVVDESGVITLTGTVASEETRQAAQDLTQQQEGVIQVIDELEVQAPEQEGGIPGVAPPSQDVHGTWVGTWPESADSDAGPDRHKEKS